MNRMVLAALVGASGLVATGCTSTSSEESSYSPPAIATATVAGGASWVVVPMGHLDDPLNTFWQLFVRPANSTTWTNATQTGMASNGGMVMTPTTSGVALGALPSNLLYFSSIVRMGNHGATVSQVGPVESLSPVVSSITSGANGWITVLTGDGSRRALMSLNGTATTAPANALNAVRGVARSCAPKSIDAIGSQRETLFLGATCSRQSSSGLFVVAVHGAQPSELSVSLLPTGVHQVRSILTSPSGSIALIETRNSASMRFLSAVRVTGSPKVLASAALANGSSLFFQGVTDEAVAIGLRTTNGDVLWRAKFSGGWNAPLNLPLGTGAVGSGPAGSLVAFVATNSKLTLSTQDVNGAWKVTTVLKVPIQYGSSGA